MNSRRILIGALIGCGGLIVIGVLLVAALVLGANISMQKAKDQAKSEGTNGEIANTPSPQ